MKNEKDYSRLDALLKVLLIVFVSLLAFSIGVFTGKKMSDEKYDLISLNNKEYSKDKFTTATLEPEAVVESPLSQEEAELMSQEVLANARTESLPTASREVASKTEPKSVQHISPEAIEPETHKDIKKPTGAIVTKSGKAMDIPAKGAVDKAAENVTHGKAPTPQTTPTAVPAKTPSLPQGVGTQTVNYTVQVAAYPSAEEAQKYAADLTQKGFPAFQVEAEVGGKKWYRVSVGSFKTASEANSYREQVIKQAGVKAAIVQKITR